MGSKSIKENSDWRTRPGRLGRTLNQPCDAGGGWGEFAAQWRRRRTEICAPVGLALQVDQLIHYPRTGRVLQRTLKGERTMNSVDMANQDVWG
jgi:hypothetical protein